MNKFKLTLALSLLLTGLLSNSSFAQTTAAFTGAWEYVKPVPDAAYPFVTVVRTVDDNGRYTQIRVTAKGSFIWQIAKLEIVDEQTLKEHIEYCINPELTGQVLTIKYKFDSPNESNIMTIEGGSKIVDGLELPEWQEAWRKLETAKKQ